MPASVISRLKRKFLTASCLTLLSLLLSKNSYAFENPQRYYDWGPSYTRVNPRILGAETDSSGSAQVSPTTVSVQNISGFNGYLFGLGANLNPDSPFYFIKTFQETIAVTFTPNPVRREELRLQIAGQRVEELHYLSENGKNSYLTNTSRAYFQTLAAVSANLEEVKDKAPDANKLLSNFEEESSKHLLVLEQVALKVPDAAKDGLEQAIASSEKVVDQVADLSGKPALPVDVLDRIQALKAQGLLSEEEAQKLVSSSSRASARVELRRYAEDGVFPEADISKLNEFARERFRDDFNRVVEYKKFFELKRLEEEKPDEETISKVQEFAKSYKAGEIVPPDLRRYWVPMVRLEELQNTVRPDLIDSKVFESRKEFFDKFQELVERTKPRPEDMAQLGRILSQNPNAAVDPFYERVLKIAERFGASCGNGLKWFATSQASGYCAPENINSTDFVQPEFKSASSCGQTLTSAKGPEGVCVTFPNTCIPGNWTKVDSCAATPTEGQGNQRAINRSCPSNSHWASVPYMPDGGYCVPNITYTTFTYTQTTVSEGVPPPTGSETICPEKYHRNYPGGPCTPDTYFGPSTGYTTYTPGYFPSPVYGPVTCPGGYIWSGTTCLTESRSCGFGTHWDPQTRGCASDTAPYIAKCGENEYSGPNGVCTPNDKSEEAGKCSTAGKFWTGRECLDKAPESGAGIACPENQTFDSKNKVCTAGGYGGIPNEEMGNCRTPGECYDWCKSNPGKCSGFNENTSRPGDNPEQAAQCFRSGGLWDGITCRSRSSGSGSCWSGSHWVPEPTNPSGGYCAPDNSGNTGTGNTGACPTGMYRGPNGNCTDAPAGYTGTGTPSREAQEAACRSGGGVCVSWFNNACGCERSGTSGSGGTDYSCPSGMYRGPGGYCIYSGGGNTGGGCPAGQYMGPGGYCISSSTGGSGNTGTGSGGSCPSGMYMGPGGYCISSYSGSGSSGSGSGGTNYTPPSGYGSCGSGQYWNGSSCVNSTYTPPSTSETPEQACLRGTGCSWTGSSCNCPSSSPTTTSAPAPAPTTAPAEPAATTAPSEPAPTIAPSGNSGGSGGGTSCSGGTYWNGTSCVQGQY